MSRQPGPDASSDLLAELDRARHESSRAKRSARAWRVISRAYGHPDWPLLMDFALEHGLVRACADDGRRAKRGAECRALTWVNPMDDSEMVWIPRGPFFIGPQQHHRQAHSEGFSLARHPVTNAQFAHFLEETGYTPPAGHPEPDLFLAHWERGTVPQALAQHPVVWVSYLDALAYCDWAGLTLPTEWLWEKAARGPDGPPFPWGEASPRPWDGRPSTLANVRSEGTKAVGSYAQTRTAFGCEDMIGNVSEWCRMTADDHDGRLPEQRPDAGIPGPGAPRYAAVRGSCFLRSSRDRMPAWHRRRLSVTRRNRWVGFRPACFLPCCPA